MCDYNKVFKEIAEYRRMKEQAEAELERLENEIKTFMADNKFDELVGAEHKATYKAIESKRVDTTRLKREMPNVAEEFSKISTSMRFTFV